MPTDQTISPGSAFRARILVVDDDPLVTQLIVDALTGEGYQLDSVTDGVAALERLEHQRYDLILSDLHMPNLDGVGLYHALTQRQGRPLENIIFLTGSAGSSDLHHFLKTTGLPVLRKPFTLVELLQLVHRILNPR